MPWRGSRGSRARGDKGLRAKVLRRDRFCRCEGCSACYQEEEEPAQGCLRPSTEADHLIPVAEGGEESERNLFGMCSQCHKEKTKQESLRGLQRHSARGRFTQDPGHPGIV
jgi:5-methylcytosine-specific restriction protein A